LNAVDHQWGIELLTNHTKSSTDQYLTTLPVYLQCCVCNLATCLSKTQLSTWTTIAKLQYQAIIIVVTELELHLLQGLNFRMGFSLEFLNKRTCKIFVYLNTWHAQTPIQGLFCSSLLPLLIIFL